MTDTDKTPPAQSESVAFQFDLPHPPEKVWRALTDPDLLAQWLLPVVDFGLAPGTIFLFQAQPQPSWDGIVSCRMLEVVPGQRISWSWVVGDIDTVLTFTLTPTVTGTQLSLLQTGFKPHQKQNFGGARYGWKMMGSKLIDLLERSI